ncbi:putative strictosidine synthase [Helianthus debilis subsp. tardiflorus]
MIVHQYMIQLVGILKLTEDGEIEALTDEAEGVKFGTTDAVTVAKNGVLYFTDASWKYDLHDFALDLLEGRPYGRLMSYDPSTKQTKVIARNLYYANGVEMSPEQDFVVFCETPMMRCSRYYIHGEKEGSTDVFIDRLPGMPDNIRYDGEGHYWIGIAAVSQNCTNKNKLIYPPLESCVHMDASCELGYGLK